MVAEEADRFAIGRLDEYITSAAVGIRILLAGPQVDVQRASALALESGLVGEELILAVTSDRAKRVFCPHCKARTATLQGIGAIVPCSGCGRNLEIYHHFSRRTASYLGFMAGAEEPAGRTTPAGVGRILEAIR
ncbi:dimethylamine monooxygenase subunit DmmA family protein [Arthrobacter cavernae]|uniref:Dimethylamine monooxygenase subunit DmmA-like C-terminal domain-containing protein n=1 Tax=Arthrobacter cavernae TaxID=2817681 RepID=A0A939HDN7_9MICC|nr:dimethylamine monooxygenase subunit DmmA family protein [Arthrobacter cavernae]MBO1267274.1 hypothetical protein [Arthrobacter cavernae]